MVWEFCVDADEFTLSSCMVSKSNGRVTAVEVGSRVAQFLQNFAPDRFSARQFGQMTIIRLLRRAISSGMDISSVAKDQVRLAQTNPNAIAQNIFPCQMVVNRYAV